MNRDRKRFLVAALVGLPVLVAALVALRLPRPSTPAEAIVAGEPVWVPATTHRFELTPESTSPAEAGAAIAAAVSGKVAGLDHPLTRRQADNLSEIIESRLSVTLLGDFDAWMREVTRFAERPDLGTDGKLDAAYRDNWALQAPVLARIPCSAVGTSVRWVRRGGVELKVPRPMAIFGTVNGGAYNVGKPALLKGDAIEVLVPMKIRPKPGENSNLPATVGFQFVWSELENRWRPFTLRVYVDQSATINLPVY